jgi:hypothetical protein
MMAKALAWGEELSGIWIDRTGYYNARRRNPEASISDFTETYDVKLTPYPHLKDLSEQDQQKVYRDLLEKIEKLHVQKARDENKEFMGTEGVLQQEPHKRPHHVKWSPAPSCLASNKKHRQEYQECYRAFANAYHAASRKLLEGHTNVTFPQDCYLPPFVFQLEGQVQLGIVTKADEVEK